MDAILVNLGYGDLVPRFADNEVGLKEAVLLSDEDFAALGVVSIGGRALLRNRCKLELQASEESPALTRLREFQSRRQGRQASLRTPSQRFAQKATRKTYVGWKHSFTASDPKYQQITASKGGGTHSLDLGKDLTLEEVKSAVENHFFPNGISRHQALTINNLERHLTTFTGDHLTSVLRDGQPFTLGAYFCQTTNPVRIYLQTCPTPEDEESSSTSEELISASDELSLGESESAVSRNRPDRLRLRRTGTTSQATSSTRHVQPSESSEHLPSNQDEGLTLTPVAESSDRSQFVQAGTPDIFFRISDDDDSPSSDEPPRVEPDGQMVTELEQGFLALYGSLGPVELVTVSRSTLLEDLLKVYKNPEMPLHRVRVKFQGESGDDYGGLTKDLLTNGWKFAARQYFEGEDAVVPYLPLHKVRLERETFILLGRLLSHIAALLSIVPPRLSRCTLLGIVYGDDTVDEKLLLEEFLLYLPTDDRTLISKALNNFASLSGRANEALIDFFTIHGIHELPSANKIRQRVLSIAQVVLIDRPAPLVAKLKQGVPAIHRDLFWSLLTVNSIDYMFQIQRPTADKVVQLMTTSEPDLKTDEERSYYFFKQYVRQLDQEELGDLLLFITGSTVMPDTLTVSFRHVTGEQRCPIVHTCSNLIEIPSSYTSLQDLKREFRALLACSHSFEMSIM